jgi:hypothetical protein
MEEVMDEEDDEFEGFEDIEPIRIFFRAWRRNMVKINDTILNYVNI